MTAPSSAASAPSAMEVLAKAEARAKTIRSCAYEEQFTDGKDPLKVSFRGSRTDYEINLQVGSAEATFIVHGDTSYTRGNAAFWSKVKGRNPGKGIFVQVPTSQLGPATRLTLDRTLRKLIALAKSRALPVVSDGEAAGISAWTLIDRAGARAGTFSVSKDTFDVLRVSSGNREFGAFTFSGWNDTFDIPTPLRSLVVKGRTAPAGEASASA